MRPKVWIVLFVLHTAEMSKLVCTFYKVSVRTECTWRDNCYGNTGLTLQAIAGLPSRRGGSESVASIALALR